MVGLNVKNISKTFEKGTITALKDINLDVRPGELFGIIGPDGAGKTTLFRILTTLLLADTGSAQIGNLDIVKEFKEIRKIVGYMPGKFSLYQDLSIEENLNFFATVFNTTLAENYNIIKEIYVQIEPFKNRLAGKLSGGMKQKLALCCALIHKPEILFLDEPTTGVDPVSRKEFWDMLDRLIQQGITIVVSTPYMDEASRCHRIALIQKGEILEVDSLQNIINRHKENTLYSIKTESNNRYQLISDVRQFAETESCFAFGEENHVTLKNNDISGLADYLKSKYSQVEIKEIEPNIEDTFIKLMLQKNG